MPAHGATPEDLLRFWIGHGDRTVTDRYAKLREDISFRKSFRKSVAEQVGVGYSLAVVPQCPLTLKPDHVTQVTVH